VKIADAKTIRAVDGLAMRRFGISGLVLMENAGRGVAEVVLRELASFNCARGRVAIIAGKGNNGGDGFVAARHLVNSGARVVVYSLAKSAELKGDAAINARIWSRMGGETVAILSKKALAKNASSIERACVVVDAIFGTGLAKPVKGLCADVIEFVNGLAKASIISVDIPSGIDASTGAVLGCAVKADVTATMAMGKIGLCQLPGLAHTGRVEVVDIGVPRSLTDDPSIRWNLTDGAAASNMLKPRSVGAHKGSCGHLVVAAGSMGKTGAAYMAATGAMRAGAGLVTLAVPDALHPVMEAKTTEVMTAPLPQTPDGLLSVSSYPVLKALMEGKSALVFGPGLGCAADVSALLDKVLKGSSVPVVIDADGLNCLAGKVEKLKKAKCALVLTPHPGEMARLLGRSVADIQKDRMGVAGTLAEKTGAVVVLKGAATVIASPDGQAYINPTGSPALATAGTGDVLSGMIGGLIAQGLDAMSASVAAVYAHGLASDRWKDANSGEAGMMATDLLGAIPSVLNSLMHKRP